MGGRVVDDFMVFGVSLNDSIYFYILSIFNFHLIPLNQAIGLVLEV